MVHFIEGTLDLYKALGNAIDSESLYFLSNHLLYKGENLISDVHTIAQDSDFPETPTDDMRENYYISLDTGVIKYVTFDKQYLDISQLMFDNVVLSSDNITKLITELKKQGKSVTMPTLVVNANNEHQLVWTGSNAVSFIALDLTE